MLYTCGISTEGDVIDLGLEHGFISKAGAWFTYNHPEKGDIRLGQGRESVRKLLIENTEMRDEISNFIREKMNPVKTEAATTPKDKTAASAPSKTKETKAVSAS